MNIFFSAGNNFNIFFYKRFKRVNRVIFLLIPFLLIFLLNNSAAEELTGKRREAEAMLSVTTLGFLKDHDVDAARKGWQKANKTDPSYPAPYYNLGILEEREGNISEAIAWFEGFLKYDTTSEQSVRARIKLEQNRQVQELTKTKDGQKQYRYSKLIVRARELRNENDYKSAIKEAKKAIKLISSRYESYIVMASILMRQKEYEKAEDFLQKALDRCPSDKKDILKSIVEQNHKEREFDKAMAEGRAAMEKKDFTGAAISFDRALTFFPQHEKVILASAMAHGAAGNYEKTVQMIKPLQNSSDSVVSSKAASALYRMEPLLAAQIMADPDIENLKGGVAYLRSNTLAAELKLDEALNSSNQAIAALALDPTYARYFILRGRLRMLSGDVNGAKKDYKQAWKINPHEYKAASLQGDLSIIEGNISLAGINYGVAAQACRNKSIQTGLLLRKGAALIQEGEFSEAIESLTQVIENTTDSFEKEAALLYRASALDHTGQAGKRKADLHSAQKLRQSPWTDFLISKKKKSSSDGKTKSRKLNVDIF